MNPNRFCARSSLNALQWITYSLLIVLTGFTGISAYSPLSFCGPSTSMPSVFPSRDSEWQFAHVGSPVITVLLSESETYRSCHLIIGSTESGSGLITPRSSLSGGGGISGTSRYIIGAPTGSGDVATVTTPVDTACLSD